MLFTQFFLCFFVTIIVSLIPILHVDVWDVCVWWCDDNNDASKNDEYVYVHLNTATYTYLRTL